MGIKEDKDFELMLQQNNHKDIMKALTDIIKKLSREPTEIKVDTDISGIEKAIKKLNMNPELSKLPTSIKLIGEEIIKKIERINIKEKPSEWTHTIERDSEGFIKIVKSKSN